MQISPSSVAFINDRQAVVSWNGNAALFAWVFVNGFLVFGPEVLASAARSVTLKLPDPYVIEIHETANGEAADPPINIPLARRPSFTWSPVSGTAQYNVHHQSPVLADYVLATVRGDPDTLIYEFQSPKDLRGQNGAWNFFHIEAQNSIGQETARQTIPFLVAGLPPPATTLAVSGAAGVFTFALGIV